MFIPLFSGMHQSLVKLRAHCGIEYTETNIMGNQSTQQLALFMCGWDMPWVSFSSHQISFQIHNHSSISTVQFSQLHALQLLSPQNHSPVNEWLTLMTSQSIFCTANQHPEFNQKTPSTNRAFIWLFSLSYCSQFGVLWWMFRCRDHRPLQSAHWILELVKRRHCPLFMNCCTKWHDGIASEFSSMLSYLMVPWALGPAKKKLPPNSVVGSK